MVLNSLCGLKHYFQEWGNFWQVFIGTISVIIVLWLWFKDRKKEVKIKELAEQTRILSDLLDVFVKPNLITTDINYSSPYTNFRIQNTGGQIFNLEIGESLNNCVQFTGFTQSNFSTYQKIDTGFSWIKDKSMYDEVQIIFFDKLNRKYSQKLVFEGGSARFESASSIT